MIELPEDPAPNGAMPEAVDYGHLLQPGAGADPLRVNRPGGRMRVALSWAPMKADVARVFNRRLMAAVREGLRVEYPLLGLSQGAPGNPVIDGDAPSGQTLPLRGLTPGYTLKEGYALTLVDGEGNRCLHFAGNTARAGADGKLTITGLEPPLRRVFADGDTVLLAKPTIDGAVTTPVGWSLEPDHLVRRGALIVIEETAGLDPALGA